MGAEPVPSMCRSTVEQTAQAAVEVAPMLVDLADFVSGLIAAVYLAAP